MIDLFMIEEPTGMYTVYVNAIEKFVILCKSLMIETGIQLQLDNKLTKFIIFKKTRSR